jgi:hypothetical protein
LSPSLSAAEVKDSVSRFFSSHDLSDYSEYLVPVLVFVGGIAFFQGFSPVVLSLFGWTKTGVAVGSIAAKIQSVFYGGGASGMFSMLQSAGVVGVSWVWTSCLSLGGALAPYLGNITGTKK